MPPSVTLRPMQPADIPAVVAVEQAAYNDGWQATTFERELTGNGAARYIVLEEDNEIIGFAGLWLMLDEAHVVTVGVLPQHRRRGLGRLLVHGLILLAIREGMQNATLECRVSNTAARELYARYGFYEVGTRKKYYQNNNEDAIIMTTEEFATSAYQRRLNTLGNELEPRWPGVIAAARSWLVS